MAKWVLPTMEEDDEGNKSWYLNGKRHREDGPAVEGTDGSKFWWLNGKKHREDGPAEEYADGDKFWWLNGKQHREDGPAVEYADGEKSWYLKGKLHREDGPAEEWDDGSKFWYLKGKKHREDGPAEEWASGNKFWYLNDKEVTKEDVVGNNTSDKVNNPSHYNQAGIECIDAIKASLGDGYQDYCKGNVMKYLWRYKYKNGIEDLKKAQWYLNSMVEKEYGNG